MVIGHSRRFQFGLWGMFALVTVVALVVAICGLQFHHQERRRTTPNWREKGTFRYTRLRCKTAIRRAAGL